jgi:phage replication O-like protein O
MANPQKENGHTDIAHEILETLARQRLSPNEWRVLMVIFRKTYGWQKSEDRIPLSQFVKMTDMKKPNVHRAITQLIRRNIVIRTDNKKRATYRFQKNWEKWKKLSVPIKPSSNTIYSNENDSNERENLTLSSLSFKEKENSNAMEKVVHMITQRKSIPSPPENQSEREAKRRALLESQREQLKREGILS